MHSRQNYPTDLANLPSLELTLDILLNRQEKDWGCFQVVKEEDFYALYIPTMDSFKLYKNPKSENYRGYWRNVMLETLPDVKNSAEKPDIFLRNRSKQVEVKIGAEKPDISLRNSNRLTPERKITPQRTILKKQRIIDVKYRYNACPEMYRLNQMIAKLIRSRLEGNLTFDPSTEIMPLILDTQVKD